MKHLEKDNRKASLAQIHIAKKQLGLDDDIYREMLENLTGKRSCSDMTLAELYQVIKHLENVGFKKNRGSQPRSRRQRYYSPRSQGQVIDVMRALWIQMHQAGVVNDGSEQALTAYAKRMSSQLNGGIGVDSLEWLERDEKLAVKVLEALKKWWSRMDRQWHQEDLATCKEACRLNQELGTVDVIRRLLQERRIFWWPEFEDYGLDKSHEYCTNRKELQHD